MQQVGDTDKVDPLQEEDGGPPDVIQAICYLVQIAVANATVVEVSTHKVGRERREL